MIVLIDNYDSFTYNIYQYISYISKEEILVCRNDQITIENLEKLKITNIIISPGPGRPEDAGITKKIIKTYKQRVPILGICLGHQAICQSFGETIVHSKKLYHGKTSTIRKLKESIIFKGFEEEFEAGRYHSLSVQRKEKYDNLDILAISDDDEIMAVKHKKHNIYGVQFHPESILTKNGINIFKNFMEVGKDV